MSRGLMEGINKHISAREMNVSKNTLEIDDNQKDESIEQESELIPEIKGNIQSRPKIKFPQKKEPVKLVKKQDRLSIPKPDEEGQSEAVEIVGYETKREENTQVSILPGVLTQNEKSVRKRLTTFLDIETYDKVQSLKKSGIITSITELVNTSVIEFIEKFKL